MPIVLQDPKYPLRMCGKEMFNEVQETWREEEEKQQTARQKTNFFLTHWANNWDLTFDTNEVRFLTFDYSIKNLPVTILCVRRTES